MKRLIAALLAIILLLGAVSCATPGPDTMFSIGSEEQSSLPEFFVDSDKGDDGSSAPGFSEGMTVAPATTVPISAPPPAPEIVIGSESFERMIVRTGDMYLVVEDVAVSLEQIAQLAETYDGYVVSSNSWQDGERMMGNISIRVDAVYFNSAIQSLRAMAVEVERESTSGQDEIGRAHV